MKVTARLSESGQQVEAANDADWALVHPPRGQRRPILFCPERTCNNRVTAVEFINQAGLTTRFFRFVGNRQTCEHAEADPVVVEPEVWEHHGETPEHRWLKDYVRRAALDHGHHDVQLEAVLNDRVRADVFVPGVVRGRVEVQRGEANVPDRTESFAEVVWLLRAAFNETNKRYLFTCPCVQVRIVRREAGRTVLAEPWVDGQVAQVRATGTVLRARADPDPTDHFGFFENEKNVDLAAFLADVWSGRRRWHPQLTAHKFAGWITADDFVRYESWRARGLQPARELIDPPPPSPAPTPAATEVPIPAEPAPAPSGTGPESTPGQSTAPAIPDTTPVRTTSTEVSYPAPVTVWSRVLRWLFGPR